MYASRWRIDIDMTLVIVRSCLKLKSAEDMDVSARIFRNSRDICIFVKFSCTFLISHFRAHVDQVCFLERAGTEWMDTYFAVSE